MATFDANPNESNEPWIERAAIEGVGFRIWHLIFFCFSGITVLVILVCCCVKIRVPRTKQDIEADHQRKIIAAKFRRKLEMIKNNEMDAMDLKKALEIIQEDLRNENKTIDESLSMGRKETSEDEEDSSRKGGGTESVSSTKPSPSPTNEPSISEKDESK